jgi:hypothetical protein
MPPDAPQLTGDYLSLGRAEEALWRYAGPGSGVGAG